jgi:hypothetical protein
MKSIILKLVLIIVGGGLLYAVSMNIYSTAAANVLVFGYFILTIRLYELLEFVEDLLPSEAI